MREIIGGATIAISLIYEQKLDLEWVGEASSARPDMPINQFGSFNGVENRQFWTLIPKFFTMDLGASKAFIFLSVKPPLAYVQPKVTAVRENQTPSLISPTKEPPSKQISKTGIGGQRKTRKEINMEIDACALLEIPETCGGVFVLGNKNHYAARVGGCSGRAKNLS
ncbi:hypothetical protein SLEP1_g3185 [Rubroshorea leprosula]|uniref:Uncharacterized protein n=1 Tax=Rubroshorea leprosula TaxID=152421 RepID=A0AAV5HT99_9ROSI|nr:hypothetical protein SLEP1_g3185 [Rubroshorea leprosula]